MELFRNAHEALTFAFNYSAQQYALSPMAKLMKTGHVGSGKGLVALDGAGQAGLIRGEVDRMPARLRACIVARYSRRVEPCSCCGGDKMVPEYAEAISTLAEWSLQCITGLSHRVMRQAIVRSFFERGISIQEVAKRHNIAKSTAHDQKSVIWAKLKELDSQAQREAEDRLAKFCGDVETV